MLGVFAGKEQDLQAEKKIFGKDFAYIRDIRNFSNVVGQYLQKILRTNYIKKYLSSKTTGFSKTRVQIEEFLNTKIPLPSLSKQREIVEKI